MELIANLLRYRTEKQPGYFNSKRRFGRTQEFYVNDARRFVENGGQIQLWKTRLMDSLYVVGTGPVVAKPGEQNIVRLRNRYQVNDTSAERGLNASKCGAKISEWSDSVFMVAEDFRGPAEIWDSMSGSSLLVYEGDPVLVSLSGSQVSISSPTPKYSCELTYRPTTFKK